MPIMEAGTTIRTTTSETKTVMYATRYGAETVMYAAEIEEIACTTTSEDDANKATAENVTGKATRIKTEETKRTTAKSENEETKKAGATATVKILKKNLEANANVTPREDLTAVSGVAATVTEREDQLKTNTSEAPRKRPAATSETAAKEVEEKVKSDARKPRTS
jgi:hypothetical protein